MASPLAGLVNSMVIGFAPFCSLIGGLSPRALPSRITAPLSVTFTEPCTSAAKENSARRSERMLASQRAVNGPARRNGVADWPAGTSSATSRAARVSVLPPTEKVSVTPCFGSGLRIIFLSALSCAGSVKGSRQARGARRRAASFMVRCGKVRRREGCFRALASV